MKRCGLPEELIEEVKSFNCVLFTGAGTTTEQSYFRDTFAGNVREKCKYPNKAKIQSFPELMQYYCQKLDGGRKISL